MAPGSRSSLWPAGRAGVGKSTVAVNLALALRANGHAVGLVDADLYGPDVPRMLGLRRKRDASSVTLFAARGQMGSRLEVVERHGIQLASAGFLLGESQGLGIQADIAQLLVHRLIADAAWADVDCLLVDLPPGDADQGLPVMVTGAVPEQVAAYRSLARELDQRIGGLDPTQYARERE